MSSQVFRDKEHIEDEEEGEEKEEKKSGEQRNEQIKTDREEQAGRTAISSEAKKTVPHSNRMPVVSKASRGLRGGDRLSTPSFDTLRLTQEIDDSLDRTPFYCKQIFVKSWDTEEDEGAAKCRMAREMKLKAIQLIQGVSRINEQKKAKEQEWNDEERTEKGKAKAKTEIKRKSRRTARGRRRKRSKEQKGQGESPLGNK